MRKESMTKKLLVEGAKLVILVVLFFLLENQIVGLKSHYSAGRGGLARADAEIRHSMDELGQLRTAVEAALEALGASRDDLRLVAAKIEEERKEAVRLWEERVRQLRSLMVDRLDSGRDRLEGARTRTVENAQRLEGLANKVQRLAERDRKRMQELMIHPTAQLRGNGTVGSGVLLYSQEQPSERPGAEVLCTTFVLTAHHVVLEVTGDRVDSSEVRKVNILTDATADDFETFAASLVLEDRERDLALLRLNTGRRVDSLVEFMPAQDLAALDVFSPTYAVGCPLGNRPMPTLGEISSCNKEVGRQTFWMLNAPTFFGNSGGGVYFARDFKFIGISSMIYTYGKKTPSVVPHMGLFVPLRNIYEWLDEEGFSFIYERKPVPKGLSKDLVYHRTDELPTSLRSAVLNGFPPAKE